VGLNLASKWRQSVGSPTFWIVVLLVSLWLIWSVPFATGQRTLFLRDVVTGALPLKHFGAVQLSRGAVPVFNPQRALGQPHSGNPNTLPFYPGNVLYLVLPFWRAFNLHYALHLLLCGLTMYGLCRKLGLSKQASLLGALTYAGSGWVLSCLTFYNILTVAAWWPLAMVGALAEGRRAWALGGFAVGMAVLGGEPLTVAIGLVPLTWLAVSTRGWRHGFARLAMIGAVGVLVALPQLVATLRVFDFTIRGGPGLPASKPGIRAFHPIRLLELVIPFPFGEPGDFGPRRYWQFGALPTVPYFYTIYFGMVGIWLAAFGTKTRKGWLLLAIAGTGFGWLGGLWPGLMEGGTAGLFRYSEKFLFWSALAVPILAAFGLERVVQASRTAAGVSAWLIGGVLLSVAALVKMVGPRVVAASRGVVGAANRQPETLERTTASIEAHLEIWLVGLAVAGLVSIAAGFAVRRRSESGLIALQLLSLLQLYPLAQTMALGTLIQTSSWMNHLPREALIHNAYLTMTAWQPQPEYLLDRYHERTLAPIRASELDPAFGLATSLSYPLAEDFEGIYSPLSGYLLQYLETAGWQQRINWSRILGVQYLLLVEDPGVDGLDLVASERRYGVESLLFAIRHSAPPAWWPESLLTVAEPAEQIEKIGMIRRPESLAIVAADLSHNSGARVEVLEEGADRWRVAVRGEGGVLVLRRAYQPLLRARIDDRRLTTLPVDFCLLGIEVPPGDHVVTVEASRRPETVAWIVSVATILSLLWLGRRE